MIEIFKGDSTIFANSRKFVTFKINTALKISNWQAIFTLGSIKKVEKGLEDKSFDIVIESYESALLPLGVNYGTLRLIDDNGHIKTVATEIPFSVTDKVICAQRATVTLDLNECPSTEIDVSVGGGGSVSSVNGQDGDVILTFNDIEGDLSYTQLIDKPKINGKELINNVSLTDIGAQPSGDYVEKIDLDPLATKDEVNLKADKTELDSYATKEELNDKVSKTELNTKIDKNQGSQNNGKFLGIGPDGNVIPTVGFTEVSWGDIKGTLNNQTDLQDALGAKAVKVDVDKSLDLKADKTELTNYATKKEVALKADKTEIEKLAVKSEVESSLNLKADKTELSSLATKDEVNLKADKTELNNYATKSELNDKADKAELNSKVDKNQGSHNNGKFLGIGPDGNVVPTVGFTEVSWGDIKGILNNQTDLREELDAKVATTDVNKALDLKADKTELEGLAVQSEVEASLNLKADKTELDSYATKEDIKLKADKTELTPLATKKEVELKADKTELEKLAVKSEVDAALDLKADRSQLTPLATKEEVKLKADKTELANYATKQELGDKADKSELNTKIDKNQGAQYSGKVLGIGPDGNVTPVSAGGGGGGANAVWGEIQGNLSNQIDLQEALALKRDLPQVHTDLSITAPVIENAQGNHTYIYGTIDSLKVNSVENSPLGCTIIFTTNSSTPTINLPTSLDGINISTGFESSKKYVIAIENNIAVMGTVE